MSRQYYFPSVDVLRAIAAFSVLIYHVIEFFEWKTWPESGPWSAFRMGWLGLDLFFVISGFVIGLSAFAEIEKNGVPGFRLPFMRRRLARIVPLHLLTCLVYLAFIAPELLFQDGTLPNVLAHVVFLHNLVPDFHRSINATNWSLGVEMQFYVFMFFVTPWMLRGRALTAILALVALAWAWRYGATCFIAYESEKSIDLIFWASTQLPGNLDEFAAGLFLAHLVRTDRGQAALAWGRSRPWLPVVVALPLLVMTLWMIWLSIGLFWRTPWIITFSRTLFALTLVTLVFSACCLQGRVWLMLTHPLRYLGEISYGVYLWHLPVIMALKRLPWVDGATALPIVIGMTTLFASVSWHFFEKPIMARWGRKCTEQIRVMNDSASKQ